MFPGSAGINGRILLAALMEAGVKDLWIVNVGAKIPYLVWHAMFEGSVVPRTPVEVDIGRMHFREDADSVPLIRTGGDGRLQTLGAGRSRTVTRTTYPLFLRQAGTINYEFTVRPRQCYNCACDAMAMTTATTSSASRCHWHRLGVTGSSEQALRRAALLRPPPLPLNPCRAIQWTDVQTLQRTSPTPPSCMSSSSRRLLQSTSRVEVKQRMHFAPC